MEFWRNSVAFFLDSLDQELDGYMGIFSFSWEENGMGFY